MNTAADLLNEVKELPTPDKVDEVQTAIDQLPDSLEKVAIQKQLDAITHSAEYLIPLVVDKTVKATLTTNLDAVKKAEYYQTKTYIVAALDKLSSLSATIKGNVLYSDIVTDLQKRADQCKADYNTMVAEQEFETNLAKAQSAMTYYEKYHTVTYQTKVQDAINLLVDSKPEKVQLQVQLDAMVADFTYLELVTKAESAITNYEKYRTSTYKVKAADALALLPSDSQAHTAKKGRTATPL